MTNNRVTTSPIKQRKVSEKYLRALKKLTPIEIEVLDKVAEASTSKEISSEIYRSPHTVKRHRQKICKKLGLEGPGELFKWCRKYI